MVLMPSSESCNPGRSCPKHSNNVATSFLRQRIRVLATQHRRCNSRYVDSIVSSNSHGRIRSCNICKSSNGPVVGEYVTPFYLRWGWTEHLIYSLTFSFIALEIVYLTETYGPVLLNKKPNNYVIDDNNSCSSRREGNQY